MCIINIGDVIAFFVVIQLEVNIMVMCKLFTLIVSTKLKAKEINWRKQIKGEADVRAFLNIIIYLDKTECNRVQSVTSNNNSHKFFY